MTRIGVSMGLVKACKAAVHFCENVLGWPSDSLLEDMVDAMEGKMFRFSFSIVVGL